MIFDAGLGDTGQNQLSHCPSCPNCPTPGTVGHVGQLFLAIRQSSQWDSLRLWDRDSFLTILT